MKESYESLMSVPRDGVVSFPPLSDTFIDRFNKATAQLLEFSDKPYPDNTKQKIKETLKLRETWYEMFTSLQRKLDQMPIDSWDKYLSEHGLSEINALIETKESLELQTKNIYTLL